MTAPDGADPAGLCLDHLVIAAATLAEGVDWCERTLGVTPAAGGRHALMGTHNRVFRLDGAAWPRAYVELIAIDPDAPAPGRARWFGLDDPVRQAALAERPQLVHWVARTADLDATRAALATEGIDAGPVLQASRPTTNGLLTWRFALCDDGVPLAGGAQPMPIQWGALHPADALPPSGVALASIAIGVAAGTPTWRAMRRLCPFASATAGAALQVVLDTPHGQVALATVP